MLEKKEVIVGLDISSSVIGISFFDSTMKLISLQAIKFKKEKLETYENYFYKICSKEYICSFRYLSHSAWSYIFAIFTLKDLFRLLS
jgi:hypothetical protein